MAVDIEVWVKQQKSEALFTLRQGVNMLEKFVQIGKANRIVSIQQARLLSRDRFIAANMGWPWLNDLCDFVEDYQLTIGWPENSRTQLLSAVQFTQWAEHDSKKGNLTLSSGASKE